MKRYFRFGFFLPCGLMLTVAAVLPNSSYGQAMVGYGINVARAGTAGVASGAGAAGIFGTLGSRTKDATQPIGGSYRPQPEFGEDDLKPTVIKLNTGNKPGSSARAGTRKMSSGVTISGISGSNASSARNEAAAVREVAPPNPAPAGFDTGPAHVPAAPAPYQPVSGTRAAGPSLAAAQPESGGSAPSVEAAANEPLPEAQATASAGSSRSGAPGAGSASVLSAPASSGSFAPAPVSSAPEDAPSAELEISVGDRIDKIIARFGKPLMALKGIAGKEYTEKYLFRTEDGLRITVLAVNGTVTAVLAGAKLAATRAALR